jgi:protoporphyrinogen IX oxidase
VSDILAAIYPWTKALHVIAMVAWMAGLFYLPRLFVYHVEAVTAGSETEELFRTMERRLLRAIMNPAMVATWILGLMLVLTPGIVDWSQVWPWTKAAAVLCMTWFHHWLSQSRKQLASGASATSARRFRVMNELPTLLLIVIVLSVIVKF